MADGDIDRDRRGADARRRATWCGLGRTEWMLLAITASIVLVVQIPLPHATAWHWFHDAARLLVGDESPGGPGGLHLYVAHPELQFGPLSAAAVVPFSLAGARVGAWLAMIVASALGLGVVALLGSTVRRLRPESATAAGRRALLLSGVLVVVVWGDVAVRTAHVDDAIAIVATMGAVWCLTGRRTPSAVGLVAVAAAAKPWAATFVPVVAAAPGPRRWVRPVVALGLAGLTWLPFVVAAPETLDVGRHEIEHEQGSSLRVFGVDDPTTPPWARPAQLIGGLVVAALLVARGRWSAAIMAAVAVRLVLDPAVNRYYTVGLVAALVLHLLLERPERVPWLAVAAAALLELPQALLFPEALVGWIRLATVATVLFVAATARPSVPLPAPAGRRGSLPGRASAPAALPR